MSDAGLAAADVFIDSTLPPGEEEQFVDTLAALGVPARVHVLQPRRSAAELQWIILAALPLQSFLSGVGSNFANDAYQAFQGAVRKLFRHVPVIEAPSTQTPTARPVVLQDATSGVQVVLEPDLPVAAYEQLLQLDLSQFRFGPIHYDQAGKRWRSELDEV